MKTYIVSERAVVLGLDEQEGEQAELLLARCLQSHGFPLWGAVESELFAFSGEQLFVARPLEPKRFRVGKEPLRRRRRK